MYFLLWHLNYKYMGVYYLIEFQLCYISSIITQMTELQDIISEYIDIHYMCILDPGF